MTLYRRSQIIAVVPAYNEEASIAATVSALLGQSRPLDRVIVVANNCTDHTAEVARDAGAEVWTMEHNPHKKAGALNWAIGELLPDLTNDDMLLITDADSKLDRRSLAAGARDLRNPDRGAVCADYRLDNSKNLLDVVQLNEYSRFSRWTRRRGGRAVVLSGVATLFRVKTIREILEARESGTLPGYPGELYHRGSATEDIEMTFAVRELGYQPMVPRDFTVVTDSMPDLKALVAQRVRWQRGMIDSLLIYGMKKWLVGTWLRQISIYLGSMIVPLYLTLLIASWVALAAIPFDARWLPVTGIFIIERVWTVRREGWKGVLTASLLLPEWIYEQVRSFAYWKALVQSLRGTERVWINS